MKEFEVLPDVLDYNLKVVICGTAVTDKSKKDNSYYAGSNNRFWDVLFKVGLTQIRIRSKDYISLLNYGIGLTDLVKQVSGNDDALKIFDFKVDDFQRKVIKYNPVAVAFNGKYAAAKFFKIKTSDLSYGIYPKKIGKSTTFVLPSTSNRARKYWNETFWIELATFLNNELNK